MPPNLVPKSPNVALFSQNGLIGGKNNVVRTDFVVQNIYSYLLGREFLIPEIPSNSAKENKVLDSLKITVDEFQASFSSTITELSATLEVCEENVESIFLGVSNELFCQGITWSRLLTLFVFASELVFLCRNKGFPVSIADDVLNILMQFVRSDLEKWVFDHGGWEGIIEFANGKKEVKKDCSDDATSGWAKAAFFGTVKMLGTLAQLATFTDPVKSFPMNRTNSGEDNIVD